MTQAQFEKSMGEIIQALANAGYDPYAQLTGYLQTGDETFITRKGDARTIIKSLDIERIALYVSKLKKQAHG